MALLELLSDKDLDLERVPTGLLKLTADSLGSAGAPEDGHTTAFLTAANGFNEGAAGVAELDPLLNAHMVTAVEATSNTLAGATQELAATDANGNAIVGEGPAIVDAAGKNPVQPLPSTPTNLPPPPRIGGGSGK